ncbi:MAG: DNA replication/repair protein RecF [bacterium]|nr:DNA replication/repair protein RecF [bacterium]
MRISSLQITQFRSYDSLSVDLSQGDVHILVGPNGVGKTNIIEAVSILSLTRSCLHTEELDLMQWGTEFYRITGKACNDAGEQYTLEVVSQTAPRVQKAYFLNDVRSSVDGMVGVLPTVVFLPQELDLFGGSPSQRRKFLDRLLCQVSPVYMRTLSQYQKVLKQRNALLKQIAERKADESHLDVWDVKIAEVGAYITHARLELIGTLQLTLPEEIVSLGESWEGIALAYDRKGTETELDVMEEELRTLLKNNRKRDCILQATTVGPHREDWHLAIGGRSIQSFASRGQQRTSLLALLLLQVSYLELRCGEKPLILLDDVFSELDADHQDALLRSLSGYQVIITTTHVPSGSFDAVVWEVGDGILLEKEAKGTKGAKATKV